MSRYSLNKLKNSFELGSTSNWVAVFQSVGANSPDASKLNIINGEFCPIIDVDYPEYEVINKSLVIGPGVTINIPVFSPNSPNTISLTLYDDHKKIIKRELSTWVHDKFKIIEGKAPPITLLKNYCLLLIIYYFDKTGAQFEKKAFYVMPADTLNVRGDQSFAPDTLPVTFNIIGTQ